MDLLQLKYFQVVAQHEHMTRAAEELGIAQPSLSKTIAHLEEELGVTLFDRQGRQIRLNQFGRAFLKHVERILMELDTGKREIAEMAGLAHGRIILSIVGVQLLPDLLSGFLAHHPHVTFRLFQYSTLKSLHQLESGEIDFCISSPSIEQAGIHSIPLMSEEIFLVVPAGHHLAERRSICLSEVANEPFILLTPGHGMRDLTDYFCQQAGFTPNIAFEGDEPASIRGLVDAGLGVTFIPALSWITLGGTSMIRLRIEEPICQRTISLSWLEERYLSQAAREFRQFVLDYFAQLKRDHSS